LGSSIVAKDTELKVIFWWSGKLPGSEFEEIMNIWDSMTPLPEKITKQKLWWIDHVIESPLWNFTGTWGKIYSTSAFVVDITVEVGNLLFNISANRAEVFFFANISKSFQHQTSFPFGNAKYLINPVWVWNDTQDGLVFARGKKWMEDMKRQDVIIGSYLNYIDFQLIDWAKMYYSKNLERLQELKAHWDPSAFWKFPMSIPLP